MTLHWHPIEVAVSLALAAGFALVGDLVLGRRSRGVFLWNESFLVGCAVSAAVLFPLSVLLPHAALDVLAVGLLVLAVTQAVRRSLRRAQTESSPRAADAIREDLRSPLAWLLLGLTVLAWLAFVVLDLKDLLGWDGFQIWATKAMVLVHEGGLRRELWEGGERSYRIGRVVAYPQLVPTFEGLLSVARGSFGFGAVKPIFIVFFTSLLVSTYRASGGLTSSPTRLAAPMLVALLPMISTGTAAGGYADMPLAAYLAAVIAALVADQEVRTPWRDPAPWLIGSLTLVKSEGIVLVAVASVALLSRPLLAGWRTLRGFLCGRWRGILVIALLVALRLAYVRWVHVQDPEFTVLGLAAATRALARVPAVVWLSAREMLDLPKWGLLWPSVVVAGAILLFAGGARERVLVFGSSLAVAAYSSIFLWTNWELELHFDNAYDRLLSQVAPAAVLVVVCAFEGLRRRVAAGGRKNGAGHSAREGIGE